MFDNVYHIFSSWSWFVTRFRKGLTAGSRWLSIESSTASSSYQQQVPLSLFFVNSKFFLSSSFPSLPRSLWFLPGVCSSGRWQQVLISLSSINSSSSSTLLSFSLVHASRHASQTETHTGSARDWNGFWTGISCLHYLKDKKEIKISCSWLQRETWPHDYYRTLYEVNA